MAVIRRTKSEREARVRALRGPDNYEIRPTVADQAPLS